jgi:import inner membrane translocase subunit TIM9
MIFTIRSMYNTLVARCFDGCVTNFRSKALDKAEITCVEQCAGRYIKMTQRVGIRFAEHQAMQQKRAETSAAGAAAGGK